MRNMRMALFVLGGDAELRHAAACRAGRMQHQGFSAVPGQQELPLGRLASRLLPGPRSLCRPMLIARRRSDLRIGRHAGLQMDRRREEMRV